MTTAETSRRWSVLIADDEPAARRGVQQLLAAYPDFAVVGECRHGGEVIGALDRGPVDLVFLDIQMPGIDGFDVIRRRTPERMPVVVFLTAYDQFAVQAFDVQAFDYLVKPVSEARFAQTMRRLRAIDAAPGGSSRDGLVFVPTLRGTEIVSLADVDWIEAADNYVRLWVGGRSHLVRESLRAFETRSRAFGFLRAHRSALVKKDAVAAIGRGADGDAVLVLRSGAHVPLARRQRVAFLKALRA